MNEESYAVNLANWDERAPSHAASPQYGVEELIADPNRLSHVVQFDVPRLGDINGLRAVHLQCHIGTDTLSLSRLGAHLSGLDFSGASIEQARTLARRAGAEIDYHQGNVYDAVDILGREQFDLVFTGVGALCWLPRIADWARVVADLLKPGGRLFIREGHPMLWSLNEERSDALSVEFEYFEQVEPLVFSSDDTYVETEDRFEATDSHSWNHGLGEIVTALLDVGMRITMLVEHNSVPWNALPGLMTVDAAGEWRLTDRPDRLAASYTLQAVKTAAPSR